jgi:pimeloyl-ACP methyl ester carboxylesterase
VPHAITDDGIRLHYEECGAGRPLVFVHEYAGDHRSWEPQMRAFGRAYRCIAFSARGYPPSDVPEDPAKYSQARARDDIRSVLDHLGIDRAHVCGLSMGGFATLHFGLAYPARALSLLVAGCGYGAEPSRREQFRDESNAMAAQIEAQGMREVAARYAMGPTRVQFRNKNPRGWSEFAEQLAGHSAIGSALTMRGVQARRPSLWDLIEDMRALRVPTLVVAGDEDDPCLEPALLMKRSIPSAGLALMPCSGHTINLEAPDEFNRILAGFLAAVDAGAWPVREQRAGGDAIPGMVSRDESRSRG